MPAKPQDQNNAHCGEPVCRRHDPGPLVDHTHPGSEHCHICRFKTLDLIIFPCESTDDLHTHHILLQAVRHFSDRIIHCEEKPADLCPETGCHQNQWKHRQQCNDRKPGVIRQHDVKDPHRQECKPDEVGNRPAREAFYRTDIFDTARDELAALGVVMIGEGQVLDVVIHAVAQVIANPRRDPLGKIAVAQIQDGGGKPKSQEKKRRLDQVSCFAARQPMVDHRLDNARYNEVESCKGQQHKQSRQYVPEIWLEKDSYLE